MCNLSSLASIYLNRNPYPGSVFSGNRSRLLCSQALKCIESNPTWALNIPSRSPPAPPRGGHLSSIQFNWRSLQWHKWSLFYEMAQFIWKRTLTDTKFLLKRNFLPVDSTHLSMGATVVSSRTHLISLHTTDLYIFEDSLFLSVLHPLTLPLPFSLDVPHSFCDFSRRRPGFSCSLISCSLPVPHGFLLSLKHVQHFCLSAFILFSSCYQKQLFPQVAARVPIYFFHFA